MSKNMDFYLLPKTWIKTRKNVNGKYSQKRLDHTKKMLQKQHLKKKQKQLVI